MTAEIHECCICLECIDTTGGFIVTECKHHFHSKCLIQNVTNNRFDCPCCRSKLIAEDEVKGRWMDESEYDDYSQYDESEYDEDELDFSDESLEGVRSLFSETDADNADEEENALDKEEEDEGDFETISDREDGDTSSELESVDDAEEEDEADLPPINMLVDQLKKDGITYEDLTRLLFTNSIGILYDLGRYPMTIDSKRLYGRAFGSLTKSIIRNERIMMNAEANSNQETDAVCE
jgi:hypothetical protein